jgi:hypothetical protein
MQKKTVPHATLGGIKGDKVPTDTPKATSYI